MLALPPSLPPSLSSPPPLCSVTLPERGNSAGNKCRTHALSVVVERQVAQLSVGRVNTKKKEKAYGNSLKHQVSEVWRRKVLTASPLLPAGQMPEGRMSAFVNHTYADLNRNLFTPAPYLRSFSADSAFYLFRLRTQDQNIIPTQEPRPNGLRQTQYLQRLCPLCAGGHVGSEAHFYLSCPRTSPLTAPLVAKLGARVPWQQYTNTNEWQCC